MGHLFGCCCDHRNKRDIVGHSGTFGTSAEWEAGGAGAGLCTEAVRLSDGFEVGVLEDEGFAAGVLEVDDGAGVLAHVGDVGDLAHAELSVADELAPAEAGGQAAGFGPQVVAVVVAVSEVGAK